MTLQEKDAVHWLHRNYSTAVLCCDYHGLSHAQQFCCWAWLDCSLYADVQQMQHSKTCNMIWVNVAVKGNSRQKQYQRITLGCTFKSFQPWNHAVCVTLFSYCCQKTKYICCLPVIRTAHASSNYIAKSPSGQLLGKEDVAHLWLPICLYLAIWPSSEVHVMQVQPSKLMPCRWNNHYTDWSVLKPQQQSFNGLQEHWI